MFLGEKIPNEKKQTKTSKKLFIYDHCMLGLFVFYQDCTQAYSCILPNKAYTIVD